MIVILLAAGGLWACQAEADPAREIVEASIERHGGADAFEDIRIQWDFRDVPFEVVRDDGRFHYQRTVMDSLGRPVVQVMENEGTWIEVDGERREVDDATRRSIETAVNSVVYFGFLPFRLDDPSVQLRDLGTAELEGEPYRKIEVTFAQEGGGRDWDDRFLYWFHTEDDTLDYLAYREQNEARTTRFRRAVNRREVGPLLLQDYENYTMEGGIDDIADYDRLFEAGELTLVSMVEFDDVQIDPAP